MVGGERVGKETGREILGPNSNREEAVNGGASPVLVPVSGEACRPKEDIILIREGTGWTFCLPTCQQVLLILTLSSRTKINMQKRLLKHSENILNTSLKHNNRVNMLSLESSFPFGTFSYFSLIGTHSGNFPSFLSFFLLLFFFF